MVKVNNSEEKELVVVDGSDVEEYGIAVSLSFDKVKYQEKINELAGRLKKSGITLFDTKKIQAQIAVLQMAMNLEIPASGITILGGHPYINTAGLLYKTFAIAKAEHQGVKKITSEPLKDKDGSYMISREAGQPAFFIGRVEFGDGTIFEDFGEASVANIKMSTIRPFLNSMAARRATNRAMRLATGVGLVSAEEISSESSEGESPEQRLLTEKEMEQIADLVAEIEAVDSKTKLDAVKLKIEAAKPSLSQPQVVTLVKVYKKKEMEHGDF